MNMRTFGVERERFITNQQGQVVPEIGRLLRQVHQIADTHGLSRQRFTYELFAGQTEDRTPPCDSLDSLRDALLVNEAALLQAAQDIDVTFDHSEFMDPTRVQSFRVNPFDERHQKIWAAITYERKIAASIVAAVHVHISVSCEEAVDVLNRCRKPVIDRLAKLGDNSNGKRIQAYCTMAESDGHPPLFDNFSQVEKYIKDQGGEKNVWDLVRYKPSTQTVEFRMFGATPSIDEILGYVEACRDVCGL